MASWTRPQAYGLAILAGLGATAAFEPLAWWPILLPSICLLGFLVRGAGARRGGAIGFGFGVTFMATLMPWLSVIGVDAWIIVSLGEGAFYALWGAAAGSLPIRAHHSERGFLLRSALLWSFLAAGLWTGMEMLRGLIPWGGLNWGRLVFAAADTPVGHAVTYVGFAGLSGLLAWAAFLASSLLVPLVTALRAGRWRQATRVVSPLIALLAVLTSAWLWPVGTGTRSTGESVQVAVIQGNAPGRGLNPFAERGVVLDNHVNATISLAEQVRDGEAPAPDLVLWPENSTDIDPLNDVTVGAKIQRAVDAIGVPVLVGALVGGPAIDQVQNKGLLWLPGEGPSQDYAKRHPVPFGEFIPLRDVLSRFIDRIALTPRDMLAGDAPGLFRLDAAGRRSVTFGDAICFEVSFDDINRELVRGGAEFIVVQTSNATFMGTGQVDQQYAMTRLRALESGRTIAVAAVSGVSAVIGIDGEPVAEVPRDTTSLMNLRIEQRTGQTPATRFGQGLEWLLSGTGVAGWALLVWVSPRRSRTAAESRANSEKES